MFDDFLQWYDKLHADKTALWTNGDALLGAQNTMAEMQWLLKTLPRETKTLKIKVERMEAMFVKVDFILRCQEANWNAQEVASDDACGADAHDGHEDQDTQDGEEDKDDK